MSGNSQPGFAISRGQMFWGAVLGVMAALKLKERRDDEHYARLATEDGLGSGPVSLSQPNVDEDAADGAFLLDTRVEGASRPRRPKRRDCCVCCGLRCGLFWKAFGIVALLVVAWQVLKLTIWAVSPSPTGLENMPEYSKSIGCESAQYLYNGSTQHFAVPVGHNRDDHSVDFTGGFKGTMLVKQAEDGQTDIGYELTIRTNSRDVLEAVTVAFPTKGEVDEGMKQSRVIVASPRDASAACTRYDAVLSIPPGLKTFHLQAHAAMQVKFDPASHFTFDKLTVTLYKTDALNMLLPTKQIRTRELWLEAARGWLVGEAEIGTSATFSTQRGDAVLNMHVTPALSEERPPAPVELATDSGAGRADIFYEHDAATPRRPIVAAHRVALGGDLYLTYKKAFFNGTVDLDAKSFSASGLQNAFKEKGGKPWVGSPEGEDRMSVNTRGWVGLYF